MGKTQSSPSFHFSLTGNRLQGSTRLPEFYFGIMLPGNTGNDLYIVISMVFL